MPYRTSPETQKRKNAMRELILETAGRIFAVRGYAGTTIQRIVDEAGTSVGNFYFYFENKDALFEILYDRFAGYLEEVSRLALEKSGGVVRGFCRSKAAELWLFQRYRGLAKALMVEASGMNPRFEQKRAEIFQRSDERIGMIFQHLKEQGGLKIDDVPATTLYCNGTIYYLVLDWLRRDRPENLTGYAASLAAFNLNSFRVEYNASELNGFVAEMLTQLEKEFGK